MTHSQVVAPSSYIPHIDGLRTVAVLSVFLFHLDVAGIDGGFIGVDVFFVISGYLITRILKESASTQSLNLVGFYVRRIRRLFPALFVMMTFCLALGFLRLSPERLMEMANSGIYALLSVSNFYFYISSDYFDAASEHQFFLHTWSLAVEEQFYLIWPLLIAFTVILFPKTKQIFVIVGICVLGASLSLFATKVDPSLAFYMMPFRAAEFGFGALLCWLPAVTLLRYQREIVVLVSLLVLAASLAMIPGDEYFPGLIVLLPSVATASLIYFGQGSMLASRLLGTSVMTYLGRISYSLYLYHWPVILFYENETMRSLDWSDRVVIFVVALVLADLSYRFVERPLRRPGWFWSSNAQVGINFALGLFILVGVCGLAVYKQGFVDRVPVQVRHVIENVEKEKARRFDLYRQLCQERSWQLCKDIVAGKRNVVILGDSHGPDALNILMPYWEDPRYVLLSENGCPPMTSETFQKLVNRSQKNYEDCRAINEKLMSPDFFSHVEAIVVSARYTWYTPEALDDFLSKVDLPDKTRLIIFDQAPSFSHDLPELVFGYGQTAGLEGYIAPYLMKETWENSDKLRNVARKHGATFLSKAGFFCEQSNGQCQLFYGEAQGLLTYDRHHLSTDAAYVLGAEVFQSSPGLLDF